MADRAPSDTGDRIVAAIRELAAEHPDWPPSRREIAGRVGVRHSTVNYHLPRLERAGRVVFRVGPFGRTPHVVEPAEVTR